MAEPPPDLARPRPARPDEVKAARALVQRAYARWVPIIGRRPAPMDDDYAIHQQNGTLFVALAGDRLAAIAVLIPNPDHLLLDNVAVEPSFEGRGYGRLMLDFTESEARRRGLRQIRLYTHVRMTKNIQLYKRAGFSVTGIRTVSGFERAFMQRIIDA